MIKQWMMGALSLCLLCIMVPVSAAAQEAPIAKEKILFVPHDGRPISDHQTADVVRKLGYEVVVPPQEMLGGRDDLGDPEKLWAWTEKNIQGVKAAVVSADSMIYGSLVASRKHNYEQGQLEARAARFAQLRQANPGLKIYVFGSIMRTPSSGANAGSEEPDYYLTYGSDIFRYTVLADREESGGITAQEKAEKDALLKAIPAQYLQDWMGRRAKNFAVNHQLIDLDRTGTFDYMILGKDDNAPFSQTHKESRALTKYGADLGATKFQAMTGIDEMGMLLLTRAVNDMTHTVPFIHVSYNKGVGGATIPAYSDERIDTSIHSAILAAGAMQVAAPDRADLVLLVNTNPDGHTYDANGLDNEWMNTRQPKDGTMYFADKVNAAVDQGLPVAVADIACANGADNALMEQLKKKGLLFKLRAYAGWNTATNSSGFVLGEGMLASRMTDDARDQLLLNRYLEDWGYQVNVRTMIHKQFEWLRSDQLYSTMGRHQAAAEARVTSLLRQFAEENLPPFDGLQQLQVTFPWSRGFEVSIELPAA